MIELLIAHLLGDWVFQSRKMAVLKGQQNIIGWIFCFLHVTIYTTWFYLLSPGHSWIFYLSIFIPHFLIDKWSLVSYWQKLRDGDFWWKSYEKEGNTFNERIEMGFGGLRYAVEDNTIHLVCLWISWNFLT